MLSPRLVLLDFFLFFFFKKPNRTRMGVCCTSPYDAARKRNANPNPNRSLPEFSANRSPNEVANNQPWKKKPAWQL